jgi:hypothetical protein
MTTPRNTKRISFLLALFLLTVILFAASCGKKLDSISMTLTPMSASIVGTATARAADTGGSDDLATAIANATTQAGEIYATQTARASINEPSRLATATAIAPVVAELPRYGIDPGDGYVAWMHAPVTINLQGYQQTGYANDYQSITAADFVMAADITWHSGSSLFGCGFMFRSDGNTNKPNQYTVFITRTASGYMAFMAMADGKIANFTTFFPKNEDKSFSWFEDATNRLAVVARGNKLDLYTNGVLISTFDVTSPPPATLPKPPALTLPDNPTAQMAQDYADQNGIYDQAINQINQQLAEAKNNFGGNPAILTDGFLGFIGLSNSGTVTCKFENAWLFILK